MYIATARKIIWGLIVVFSGGIGTVLIEIQCISNWDIPILNSMLVYKIL